MRIGILGAGRIGATVAKLFAHAGHEVAISNSRGPASLQSIVEEVGPHARAMTIRGAAAFGEVVLLAIPWRAIQALPPAETVQRKIVIDAMNPYSAGREVLDLGDDTSSETVQRRLRGARLVKAFNTLHFETLRSGGRGEWQGRLVLFLAGDDADAKQVVSNLIGEVGFAPFDVGSLREGGRRIQPNTPLFNVRLTVPEAVAATGVQHV